MKSQSIAKYFMNLLRFVAFFAGGAVFLYQLGFVIDDQVIHPELFEWLQITIADEHSEGYERYQNAQKLIINILKFIQLGVAAIFSIDILIMACSP